MISVEKYHGTGNDFVIVDADASVPDRRAFAMQYCDRADGISHPNSDAVGADGVLFLALEAEYRPPRVVMTLVQPDGSVATMCGNGARCVARWAAERTGSDEIMIDTQAGTRHARVDSAVRSTASWEHGDPRAATDVTIEMGRPLYTPDRVPLARETPLIEEEIEGLVVTAVNTGVPHAVAFVDDVDDVDIPSVAPPVRYASVFPGGANVTFASPHPDGGFDQRTFERGVEGETDSCGTGAVAIVAAAVELGRAERDKPVTVRPPGGDLVVTVTADDALLRGPVVHDFSTEIPPAEPRVIEQRD